MREELRKRCDLFIENRDPPLGGRAPMSIQCARES